jgi:hypothetical protein
MIISKLINDYQKFIYKLLSKIKKIIGVFFRMIWDYGAQSITSYQTLINNI